MRKLLILALAVCCANVYAGDICDTRATLAGSTVATKYTVRESLRDKPDSGPMGEVWRYVSYISAAEFPKLGDSPEQIKHLAKLVADNDTSNDWRIELLVYNEFFRSVCEAKLNVLDVPSIDAKALGACFGDSPPGKKDFPECIRTQVSKISESARSK